MDDKMKMPTSQLPKRGALPGDLVGQGERGDAVFYARTLASPPNGVTGEDGGSDDGGGGSVDGTGDGDGAGGKTYLYVSPRTPYDRYPLPFMGLTATVKRDGETVFDDNFSAVMHPETG